MTLDFNYDYSMGLFEFVVGDVTIPTQIIKLKYCSYFMPVQGTVKTIDPRCWR